MTPYTPYKKRRNQLLTRGFVCAASLATLVGVGCKSTSTVGPAESDVRFHAALVQTTAAINQSELDDARTHLEIARADASSPQQYEQLASLEQLILGAEALINADTQAARHHWSQITDPVLRREVTLRADAAGFDLEPSSTFASSSRESR